MRDETPLELLPDDQLLALCDLQMNDTEQHELSDLLATQREGMLTAPGRRRLDLLLRQYRSDLARKAQALHMAVQRGLTPPLHT